MALANRLDHDRPAAASRLGWRCFQLGLAFLASSALIGALLLLVALLQLLFPEARVLRL